MAASDYDRVFADLLDKCARVGALEAACREAAARLDGRRGGPDAAKTILTNVLKRGSENDGTG